MGVSICLDVVKEWVSTVEKILTASKSASRQSRSLSQDQDFSILSQHQCSDQKVSIKKFVEIWKFWRFLTVCLNLDREVRGFLYFLVKISQSVKTFHHFQTQKGTTMSRFLDKSRLCLNKSRLRLDKNLDYLEKAWLSQFISIVSISLNDLNKNLDSSKSRLKNLDFKNLDREKKKLISTVEKISKL